MVGVGVGDGVRQGWRIVCAATIFSMRSCGGIHVCLIGVGFVLACSLWLLCVIVRSYDLGSVFRYL
jgi:hypothetical protein